MLKLKQSFEFIKLLIGKYKMSLLLKLNKYLFILMFSATFAHGQVVPGTEAPEIKTKNTVDSNGIELISGDALIAGINMSIGSPQNGIAISDNSFNGMRTQYKSAIVYMQTTAIEGGCEALPPGQYFGVSAGGETATFKYIEGSDPQLVRGRGELKWGAEILYRDLEGTSYKYEAFSIDEGFSAHVSNYPGSCNFQKPIATLTRITKPDGEVIDINYEQGPTHVVPFIGSTKLGHFTSVQSSLGWMFKRELVSLSGDVTTSTGQTTKTESFFVNLSEEYCSPDASASCRSMSKPWARFQLEENYSKVGAETVIQTVSYKGDLTNPLGKKAILDYSFIESNPYYDTKYTSPAGVLKKYKRLCSGMACSEQKIKPLSSYTQGNASFNYVAGHSLEPSGYANSYTVMNEVSGPDGKIRYVPALSQYPFSFYDNLSRVYTNGYQSNSKWLLEEVGYTGDSKVRAGYDSRGNVITLTQLPKVTGSTPLVTTAVYPTTCDNPKTCNKPTSITDQNGVVTSYDYYPEHGGLKSVTKAAVDGVEAQTLYTYEQKTPYVKNSSGGLVASPQVWRLVSTSKCMTKTLNTCAGTADELRTEYSDFTHNLLSKKTTVKHGDNSVVLETTRDYDIYGNVSWEDGPRSGNYDTTYYFYDALRQKIGEIGTDPDGSGPLPRQATRIGYNDDGKVNSVKKGIVFGTSKASLDAMTVKEEATTEYSTAHGLPVAESYFANGVLKKLIQKSYNADLRLECVAHRLSLSIGADVCVPGSAAEIYGTSFVTVKDRITKYTYDVTGAVLTTSTGVGTNLARTDRTNTYRSDNGLLETEKDALGNVTSYGYDDFNRSTTTTYPKVGSDPATYTQKTYTSGKNFVSNVLLRDGQSIGFTPDPLYRIGAKTGAVVETFSYNNFDQVTSHTNSTTGGVAATSIYDRKAIGWLNSEQTAFGSVSYDYDLYGRRTKMTWPDNVYINYSYETNGYAGDQLQNITESNGTLLASFEYYDTGKRKTLTRGNGVVTTYGYDSMQRLESYSTDIGGSDTTNDIAETFSYTLAGQLKNRKLTTNNADYTYLSSVASSTTYVPNALNQIATLNGIAFEYDKRGNLTKDNAGVIYAYNANNLLLGSTNSNGTASLNYDAENRLYSVTKGSNSTRFMYDGTDLIAETNSSNTILRRYIHGPETDDPIVWYEGAGTTDKRYYTTDRQGSIVGATLQTGMNAAINAYDEYGIQKYSNFGRFQYTGQTWLPEVGLYYYKARLYSPSLGRFMQTDPIGYKDGMNWYAYVGNDPVNYIDSTGESKYNRGGGDHSGIAMADLIAKGVAAYSEPGSAAHNYANQASVVTERAMRAYADDGKAAKRLPKMKGMGSKKREATLTEAGFEKTKVSNSPAKNETWKHDDGSEVRVHPYGNEKTSEHKSGNNAHLHKQDPKGNQLDDRGNISDDPNKTHIGLPNPPNLPDIRDRKHGV